VSKLPSREKGFLHRRREEDAEGFLVPLLSSLDSEKKGKKKKRKKKKKEEENKIQHLVD
jgi:hypothetical protein